jgi:plastocyanin
MNKPDPTTDLPRQKSDYAATEDVQNVHASHLPEERAPLVGHGMLRLWLLGISGLGIVIGGVFFVRVSRDFSGKSDESAPAKAVAFAATPVSIRNLQFYPVTLEVRKGDVVEWKNDDLVPHTVTSASFNSGTIVSGQSWRHTFMDVGNVSYACIFHPQMKGSVNVK